MRLLIADDHAAFRRSLLDLLSTVDGVEVVGEAADGQQALAMVRTLKPDVVLMDVRMPVLDGIAATKAIRAYDRGVCILVLTTFDEDELVSAAIRAGANGYLLKGTRIDDVMDIVRLAARGFTALGPGIKPSAGSGENSERDDIVARVVRLTDRERDVWELLGQGMTNGEAAEKLGLSEGTVKNYVSSILGTLGVRHRTQAALLWRKLQL